MNLQTWIKSMNEDRHRSFLDAIHRDPLDPTNYLIMADFLDEQTGPKDATSSGRPARVIGTWLQRNMEKALNMARRVRDTVGPTRHAFYLAVLLSAEFVKQGVAGWELPIATALLNRVNAE